MPELKPSRAYHEALRRLGIQNPGEVGIATPVQLEAAVDDFTHLVPPISVPVVAITGKGLSDVGNHSGVEIIAGARTRGVHITAIESLQSAATLARIQTAPPDVIQSTITPLCFTGPTPQSIFNAIVINAPLPGDGAWEGSGFDLTPVEFFLAPGQRLQIVSQTVSASAVFTVFFREVPTFGPVEP